MMEIFREIPFSRPQNGTQLNNLTVERLKDSEKR